MPIAIETVIIVIVVVSFTVLAAIVFALYWLWRLLLEDRRCNRLDDDDCLTHRNANTVPGFTVVLATSNVDDHRIPLTSGRRTSFPRITRSSDVFVDERGLRRNLNKRTNPPQQGEQVPAEVVVLDGTEPPPPYDDNG